MNSTGAQLISDIGPNDVLLGRGAPFRNFQGNRRFRHFAKTLRASYQETDQNRVKSEIAMRLYRQVIDSGGRFLRCIRDLSVEGDEIVRLKGGTSKWQIVDVKVALEKCKQTLRDRDPPPGEKRGEIAMQRAQQLRAVETPAPIPVYSHQPSSFQHQNPTIQSASIPPVFNLSRAPFTNPGNFSPFPSQNHQSHPTSAPNTGLSVQQSLLYQLQHLQQLSALDHDHQSFAASAASNTSVATNTNLFQPAQQQMLQHHQQQMAAQLLQQFGHFLTALAAQKVAERNQQSNSVLEVARNLPDAGVAIANPQQDARTEAYAAAPRSDQFQVRKQHQPSCYHVPDPLQASLRATVTSSIPGWVQPNERPDCQDAARQESNSDTSSTIDQEPNAQTAMVYQGGEGTDSSDQTDISHWIVRNSADLSTALTRAELEALLSRSNSSDSNSSGHQQTADSQKPPAKQDDETRL